MKLGNVSQTIVEVPHFFIDTTKEIDAFKIHFQNKRKKIKRCHSNVIKNDLLNSNLDININNNPRLINQKFVLLNKEIYKPIYKKFITPNNCEMKETYFPDLINKKNRENEGKNTIFNNYLKYKNSTNINDKINPELRKEILNNTYNLIERINSDYDLKKYSDFDSRTTFNKQFQMGYSPLSDVIKKTHSDRDLFLKAVKEKAYSLKTINSRAKEAITNNFNIKSFYITDKENKKNQEDIKNSIDQLLDNSRTNLIKLKYNNKEPYKYNKKDKQFIEDNKFLTSRINRTKLYKNFPSKTRMELNKKKILIPKKLMKYFDKSNYITKDKYGMGKDELSTIQNDMWTRPLHKDAYKLHE